MATRGSFRHCCFITAAWVPPTRDTYVTWPSLRNLMVTPSLNKPWLSIGYYIPGIIYYILPGIYLVGFKCSARRRAHFLINQIFFRVLQKLSPSFLCSYVLILNRLFLIRGPILVHSSAKARTTYMAPISCCECVCSSHKTVMSVYTHLHPLYTLTCKGYIWCL